MKISNEWKHLVDLPSRASPYSLVAIGSDRIATEDMYSKRYVFVYNLKTKKWSTYSMAESGRLHYAIVSIGDILYIFGGSQSSGSISSSCERLEPSNGINQKISHPFSTSLPKMPTARKEASAVVYDNNKILVVGGRNNYQHSAKVEMLDTINKKWIRLPSMPTPRTVLAAGAAGEDIIIVSGRDCFGPLSIIEILNMQTQTWKKVTDMKEEGNPLNGAVIGYFKGLLFAGGVLTKSRRFYDFDKNEWSSLPRLEFDFDYGITELVVVHGKVVTKGDKCLKYIDFSPDCADAYSNLEDSQDLADIPKSDLAVITVVGCEGPQFSPELYNEDHMIAIFTAIYHGEMDLLTEVFEDDPDVNVNQTDSVGRMPVEFAAIMGQPEMMEYLFEKGGKWKITSKPNLRMLAKRRAQAKVSFPKMRMVEDEETRGKSQKKRRLTK